MTTVAWVVVGLLAAGLAVVVGAWTSAARRLTRADAAVHELERRLAAVEARDAAALARRAGGQEEPAPRVVLEPVTGPLVKAVAFGAGARRAMARLARSTGGRR